MVTTAPKAEKQPTPASKRIRGAGWGVLGLFVLLGLLCGGGTALVGAIAVGIVLGGPIWLTGALFGFLKRRRDLRIVAALAARTRCLAPDCTATATYKSHDGPWKWCAEHAGPLDYQLVTRVDR
jgi:hypothetical protein